MEHLRPLPSHVAIIMDGNGRWAELQGKPRSFGHKKGIDTAKKIITAAIDMGIRWLTLYVFSTENWKRPEKEVTFLMELLKQYMKIEAPFYHKNRIRLHHLGDPEALPEEVKAEIIKAGEATSGYDKLHLNLAINYGGRDEIIRSFRRWLGQEGRTEAELLRGPGIEALSRCMDVPDAPDPDLIIRTAGEQRMSNFLLWESAYSEYYFSTTLWPDFSPADFTAAVDTYRSRNRTYGGTA